MSEPKQDLDVAISFLNDDLGLAQELRERLGNDLDVFVYSSKQEELAGTDGLGSFRAAFRHRSRLVVILHREGWGETPWTRIEQEAITDRFLKEGSGFLFVVTLDESPPPPWLPDKLIRFSLKDFGLEQAVGAIKARALEQGSVIHRPSISRLAQQAQEAVEFDRRRLQLFRTEEGVRAVAQEAEALLARVEKGAEELKAAASSLDIEYGTGRYIVVIRAGHVSLHVIYSNQIINVLDEARLIIREYQGVTLLPGQRGYYITEPKELTRTNLFPELSRAHGWCWRDAGGEVVTSERVAELALDRFLSLLRRHAAGELPPR